MFRIVIGALALFGLFALFTGGAAGAAVGIGVVALFFLKALFAVMLFGILMRACVGRRWSRDAGWGAWKRGGPWQHHFFEQGRTGRRSRRPVDREEERRASHERFEEWHDLAHARREVDSWTDDL